MITVAIFINGNPIAARTCVNKGQVRGAPGGQLYKYECDDGKIIKHRRDDGAIKLAIEMLKGVKESS